MNIERPIIKELLKDYNCREEEKVLKEAENLGFKALSNDLFEISANTLRFKNINTEQKKNAVCIAGLSAAGKDCIAEELEKTGSYKLVISHTTRAIRENEKNETYQRVSKEEFIEKINKGDFLEYCERNGDYMGLEKKAVDNVLNTKKIPIIRTAPQIISEMQGLLPDLTLVNFFVIPESWKTTIKRLVERDLNSKSGQERIKAIQDVKYRLQKNTSLLNYIKDSDYLLINRSGYLQKSAFYISSVMNTLSNNGFYR